MSFDVSSQLDIYDTRFFVTMQHSEQQACKIKYTMSCNLKTFLKTLDHDLNARERFDKPN